MGFGMVQARTPVSRGLTSASPHHQPFLLFFLGFSFGFVGLACFLFGVFCLIVFVGLSGCGGLEFFVVVFLRPLF